MDPPSRTRATTDAPTEGAARSRAISTVLDVGGSRVLYVGGRGDPEAARVQAVLAAQGPFAVHWVGHIAELEGHALSGPIDLVLVHHDVDGADVLQLRRRLAPPAVVLRVGARREGDDESEVRSVDADLGFVDVIRYELMLSALDRRNADLVPGPLDHIVGKAFFEWDLRTDRVTYSPQWLALTGSPGEATTENGPERWYTTVHPEDRAELLAVVDAHLSGRTELVEHSYRMVQADGHVVPVRAVGVVVSDALDEPARFTASVAVRDQPPTTPLRSDPLTGLVDRTSFLDRLGAVIGSATGPLAGVLVIGVDRFSWVNDSYGHAAGDQLLTAIGGRLARTVRPDDIVARLGGDEFGVLLGRLRDPASAAVAADRVLAAIRRRFALDSVELDVNVSVGVATTASGGGSGEVVLRQAEVALQRAKGLGGGMAVVFDDDLEERASARLHLEQALRRAIEAGELTVHYQPIVDIETGRVVSLEALVRWDHPERGLLAPAEFLGVAEESGLIVPLGELVLEQACRQLRRWSNDQLAADMSVSVNVAARQFAQSDLVEVVARSLDQTGLPPERLALEITESTFIANVDAAAATLEEIRRLGVRVYADDFGTGHASLNYLRLFPIDALKIDRSFVAGLGTDADALAFVRAIIGLGHSLGLGVIAEGVETATQLGVLRSLGCEEAQGYFFSPPLSPDDLRDQGLLVS